MKYDPQMCNPGPRDPELVNAIIGCLTGVWLETGQTDDSIVNLINNTNFLSQLVDSINKVFESEIKASQPQQTGWFVDMTDPLR